MEISDVGWRDPDPDHDRGSHERRGSPCSVRVRVRVGRHGRRVGVDLVRHPQVAERRDPGVSAGGLLVSRGDLRLVPLDLDPPDREIVDVDLELDVGDFGVDGVDDGCGHDANPWIRPVKPSTDFDTNPGMETFVGPPVSSIVKLRRPALAAPTVPAPVAPTFTSRAPSPVQNPYRGAEVVVEFMIEEGPEPSTIGADPDLGISIIFTDP